MGVEFPSTLIEIKDKAFYNCENITELIFPTGSALTTIGEGAFADCYSLTGTITFPSKLATIGEGAF